jgi:hypothetical protein
VSDPGYFIHKQEIKMSTVKRGEKAFEDMVLELFLKKGAHAVNMEPGLTNPGIPDINWCLEGIIGDLELKFGCGKRNRAPHIRPSQLVWFRERIKAGGYPMLAYYIEEPKYADEVYIFQGRYIEQLAMAKKLNDLDDIPSLRVMNPAEMVEALISEIASWWDQENPKIITSIN